LTTMILASRPTRP